MKTIKVILEVEVPVDTRLKDFAVVAEKCQETLAQVGYKSRFRLSLEGDRP